MFNIFFQEVFKMPPTEPEPEDDTNKNSVVIEITDNLSENQDTCVKEISQVYKNIIDKF